MGWPQYTLMGLWVLGIGIRLAKHGEPAAEQDGSPYKWNLWTHTFKVSVWTLLLWAGGFFGG